MNLETQDFESLLLNSALQFYEAEKKRTDILDSKRKVLLSLNKIIGIFLEGNETPEEKLYLCGAVLSGVLTAFDEKCKIYSKIIEESSVEDLNHEDALWNLEHCKSLKKIIEEGNY